MNDLRRDRDKETAVFSIDADIQTPEPGGRRALVADDDPQQRATLIQHLTARGFRVSTASDGMNALTLIGSEAPSVALLQRHGADGSGERTAALAAMLYPHTRILVTASPDGVGGETVGAAEGEPFPVLRRPVNLDQLDRWLESLHR